MLKSKSLTYFFFFWSITKISKVFHLNLFIPAETPVFELSVSVWLSLLNINPAFGFQFESSRSGICTHLDFIARQERGLSEPTFKHLEETNTKP